MGKGTSKLSRGRFAGCRRFIRSAASNRTEVFDYEELSRELKSREIRERAHHPTLDDLGVPIREVTIGEVFIPCERRLDVPQIHDTFSRQDVLGRADERRRLVLVAACCCR